MNQLTHRIWLAALLMSCGWISTVWIRSGYTFEIQPLKQGLDSLPIELIGYTGTNTELDKEVSEILNADTSVNRYYVRPDGTSLTLFAAGWVRPESVSSDVCPHSPKVCYVNAGWKILEERIVNLTTPTGKLPVCFLFLERDAERCVVGFWYQMGESSFTSAQEARLLHRQFWGNKKWPATIKFLIQTTAQGGIDGAIPRIEEIAVVLHQWSLEL